MIKNIFLVLVLITSLNSLYPQENSEIQKFIYETKSLVVEVKSFKYMAHKSDSVDISISFTNPSMDTSFISPFSEVKEHQATLPTYTFIFSRFYESNSDFCCDTLLVLYPGAEFHFNFKIPIVNFHPGFSSFLKTVLDLGYFPSMDSIKQYKWSEGNLHFQNNILILPHSIIEVGAQRRQFIMFGFHME